MKILYISLISIFSLFLSSVNSYAQMTAEDFEMTTLISGLTSTNDIELADLDGDGLNDVIALDFISEGSSTIKIFRNTTLAGAISLSTSVDMELSHGPLYVEVGDINADGKLDIVTSNWPSNSITVYLNVSTEGSISFDAAQEFTVSANAQDLKLADFDNDGKLDFAICANTDNVISIFRNLTTQGGSTVSVADQVDLMLAGANSLDVGDLNQDGYIDIIGSGGSSFVLFRNDATAEGEIGFTNITSYSQNNASIKLTNFNDDDFPDLVVSSTNSDHVRVYTNKSTGGTSFIFGDVVTVNNGQLDPYRIDAGDLDGDDIADLIVSNHASNSLSVYRNTSSGSTITFESDVTFSVGSLPRGVRIGDLTGNGLNDFVVANYSSGTVMAFQNTRQETLEIYYPFADNANDDSGNEFHGSANFDDGGFYSTDRYGFGVNALEIGNNGNGGYVQIDHTGQWDFRNEVAVSFWVRSNELPEDGEGSAVLFHEDAFGEIGIDDGGHMTYANENGTYWAATPTKLGVWSMLTLTINSANELRMFVNGNEMQIALHGSSEAGQFLVIDRPTVVGSTAFVGDSTLSAETAHWFNGSIDELRVKTNGTYSNEDISSLYNIEVSGGTDQLVSRYLFTNGAMTNETSNDFASELSSSTNVTISPTLTSDRFGSSNQALFFDNSGNNLHFYHERSIYSRNQFSISMWINPSSYATSDEFGDVLYNDGHTGRLMVSSSGQLMFHYTPISGSGTLVSEDNLIPTGSWQMVGLTLEDNELRIYHNGLLITMTNVDNAVSSTTSDISDYEGFGRPDRFYLATNESGDFNRYYHGALDDVDVYQRVLSESDFQAKYNDQKVSGTGTDFISYMISNQMGESVIDAENHEIGLTLSVGSDVTSLVADFELSSGAVATINGNVQTTLSTVNDFTNPVTYTVTAEDETTMQDWIVTVGVEEHTSASDSLALLALYNATNGANWTNTWDLNAEMSTWYGVEFIDGLVSSLNLSDNNLTGTIPSEIGNLTSLSSLYLYNNQLSGSIPAKIGNLSTLEDLYLYTNELSGSVPSEIGSLGSLVRVYLYQNELDDLPDFSSASWSGTINTFALQNNKFSFDDLVPNSGINGISYANQVTEGEINEAVVTGSSYEMYVDESHSNTVFQWTKNNVNIDGATASSFTIEDFSSIDEGVYTCVMMNSLISNLTVKRNTITLSEDSENEDRAALVALYNDTDGANWTNTWDLEADMGTWFGVTVTEGVVTALDLTDNNLVGTIPSEMGNLSSLISLSLGENQLSGSLPTELGSLSNLDLLQLPNNTISGSIPIELGSLSQLTNLNFYNNQLEGEIPVELGNLSYLYYLNLGSNKLEGTIPTELGSLVNLHTLYLNSNLLNGEIPTEFGNLSNINTIHLSNNGLTGSIPASIGDLNQLYYLNIGGNELSGEIPDDLAGLTNIAYLYMSWNSLEGEIPTWLGSLENLVGLGLGVNLFHGTIPVELGNLSGLVALYLDGNQLTGTIPVEMSSLANLETLFLQYNQLTGTVPTEFSNLSAMTNLQIGDNDLDELPDFSAASWTGIITNFGLENNHFNFEDLVPNSGINGIAFGSQLIDDEIDVDVNNGDQYIMTVNEAHASTVFQWTKDGTNIEGAAANSYTIDSFSVDDNGVYSCVMTNSAIAELTITRSNVTLENKVPTLAYYPFNGSANDESGNGTHGTQVTVNEVEQAITMTEDRFGNADAAFLFENDGDHIKIDHSWDFSSGRTFVTWIHPTAFATEDEFGDVILDQNNGDRLMVRSNGELMYHYQNSSSGYIDFNSGQLMELDTWQSVAISIDASNITRLYYNGALMETSEALDFMNGSTNVFRIASKDAASGFDRYFNGAIDDVSIFDRTLSDQELLDLYNSESGTQVSPPVITTVSDLTHYRFRFDWTEVEHAAHYVFEIAYDYDFTNLVYTSDAQEDPFSLLSGTISNTTYFLRVKSSNGYLDSDWSEVVSFKTKEEPATGLIAYYPFNDDGDLHDYSENGNPAVYGDNTNSNTFPIQTLDREGGYNAYLFDGVDDFLAINEGGGVSVEEDLTLNVWVKVDEAKDGVLFSDLASNYGQFFLDENLSISYRYFDGSGAAVLNTGDNKVPTNQWSMLTLTREAAQIKMYINGVVVVDQEAVNPTGASIIAAIGQGADANSFFKGAMDDIRIFNVAISEESVQDLYLEEGTGVNAVEAFGSAFSNSDYQTLEYVGARNGQYGHFGRVFNLGVGSLKFRTNFSDVTVYGDNDQANSDSDLDGAAIEVSEAGYYFVSYFVDDHTYDIAKINSVGVLGEVLSTGWSGNDVDLVDQGNGVFEANVSFLEGEWKVRANDAWDLVDWGSNGVENDLLTFGPNFSGSAGEYTLTVDILQNTYNLFSGNPPVIGTVTFDEIYTVGSGGMNVSVIATDADNDISEVSVYHRKIGESTYNKVALTVGTSPFMHHFDEADMVSAGLQFYFEVIDSNGNDVSSGLFETQISNGTAPEIGAVTHDAVYTSGGDGMNVSVVVTDIDGDISEVSVFHKQIGASTYSEVDISGGTSPYSHHFDDADIAPLGIEFYFVAIDANGNEDTSSVFQTQISTGVAPVIGTISYDNLYTLGEDGVEVSIEVTDVDNDISEVYVYHKKVTDTEYTKVDISSGSTPFVHLFSDFDIRELGLVFYIEVIDANSFSATSEELSISTQIDSGTEAITGLKISSDSIDYSIISMPFKTVSVGSLMSDLGATDKTKWRLLHYNGSSYSELSTSNSFDPGKGYWFLNNTTSSINLETAQSVDIDENSPFTISLRNGYSQIGNPFPHSLDWQEVIDYNAINGVTVDRLLKWNRGWSSGQSSLNVYEGAFISHDASQSIEIPISAINTSSRMAQNTSSGRNEGAPGDDAWSFGLNLSNEVLHYDVSVVGVSPDSKIGSDRNDLKQLPRLAGYLDLIFDNGHTSDVIQAKESYKWSFDVHSNYLGEQTTLSWDNFPLQGNEFALILKDLESNQIVDLSESSNYEFYSSSSMHGFELHFGRKESIMSQVFGNEDYIGRPYPNPSEGYLTVPIALVDDAKATILVRDLTGRIVYQDRNMNLKKGFQEIEMNLSNIELKQGTYLVEVQTQSDSGTTTFRDKVIFSN